MTVKAVFLCISGFLVQIIHGQCNALGSGVVGNGIPVVGNGIRTTLQGANSLGNNVLTGNSFSGGTILANNGVVRTGLAGNSVSSKATLPGNGLTGGTILGNGITGVGLSGYGTNPNNLIIGNGIDINNCGMMSVTSSSPIAPSGLSVSSSSQLDGPVLVSGQLPFLAAAAMGGTVPSGGFGTASYGSNGKVGIFSENGVGVGATVDGIANNVNTGYVNSGLAGNGFNGGVGYGFGLNGPLGGGMNGLSSGFGNSLITTTGCI